jgi:hypothetical protein
VVERSFEFSLKNFPENIQCSYLADIVVGPWLVKTGREVGPVGPPPLLLQLPSAGCAKLCRRPAAGDVGAEPALDRLPITAAGGGTMQERRSRGLLLVTAEPPPSSADGRRTSRLRSSGDVTGLAAVDGGDSA